MNNEPAYKTARTALIDPKFTKGNENWPKAESTKICIFEAILVVGKAKFGSDWRGNELEALDWPLEPIATYESWKERMAFSLRSSGGGAPGSRILHAQPPRAQELQNLPIAPNAHVTQYRVEQFQAEMRKEQDTWEENRRVRGRLFEAVEWLAQKCRDGELNSYARPASMGALHPMAPFEWNLEDPVQRFVSGGSFKRYFPEYSQAWAAFIFFDRDQLDQVASTLGHASPIVGGTDLGKVSPLLRFAVNLALQKGYSSPGAVKVDARSADIEAAWDEAFPHVPLSAKTRESLTVVTGWPDPDAIRRGQLGGGRRKKGG